MGTLRSWKREEWLGVSLAATSVMCLLLAMGDFAPLAPYTLLRELPVFSQFRAPGRYLSVFVLFATATSGWALVRAGLGDLTINDGLPRLAALVLVLATIGLAFENRSNFKDVFGPPLLASTSRFLRPSHHLVIDAETKGSWPNSPMLRGAMDDRSVLDCYEPFQVRRSVDPGRDVVYSDDPTAIYR